MGPPTPPGQRKSGRPLAAITAPLTQRGNLYDGNSLFFVFVALRPMSTAMVIAGRSVHLTTLFPGQA